jgi:hypothetical protein
MTRWIISMSVLTLMGAGDVSVDLLPAGKALEAFRTPTGAWMEVGGVGLAGDPKHLIGEEGTGIILNDPPGRTTNLLTKEKFKDVEVSLDFCIPEGSNSGIKLMGLYEVQIFDSFGAVKPEGKGNGGIYPRAELLPRYRYLDEGFAPRVNASRAPGEWQSLKIRFRAPRFDGQGKKVENARFEKVELNGQVLHEDLEIPYPTGHAWNTKPEVAEGPMMLQADHGPVAFRNFVVRPLASRVTAGD